MRVFDLVMALCTATDMVSPAMTDHHKRVAYISLSLARALGWSNADQQVLFIAAALHDIGAFSLKERMDLLAFDLNEANRHAELGYQFLRRFPPFERMAEIVRYHHTRWDEGRGAEAGGQPIPLASHVLHLADRVAVLVQAGSNVLQQSPGVIEQIQARRGRVFVPELVDGLLRLADLEYFWLDIVSPDLDGILERQVGPSSLELSLGQLTEMSRLFSRIIDFKSPFTSSHSSSVAATAEALAGLAGFSPDSRIQMRIAGYLHDIGKLVVPSEVLGKADQLTAEERAMIRSHTYNTRRILQAIPDLETITGWASDHHEHLDGRGYPYHFTAAELTLGARILAVADVFTALAEDRPYRAGLDKPAVLGIMEQMVGSGKLDRQVVDLLASYYAEVEQKRVEAQTAAREEYAQITQDAMPA